IPSPSPAAPASARPSGGGVWRALLDDGREIEVDGLILLGRNPQARPGEEHASLIKIADTTRTVSKSHLEIGLNSSGLYVVDRGSTNGSTVTAVNGLSKRCTPGDPVQVEPDSIVSFGDHWLEIKRS
ncbi:MAG TPA: FHA domain-containing protein, partial [Microlunatus sp.]|nr:FHA domain-containing protein [Microlunatus sp.]